MRGHNEVWTMCEVKLTLNAVNLIFLLEYYTFYFNYIDALFVFKIII